MSRKTILLDLVCGYPEFKDLETVSSLLSSSADNSYLNYSECHENNSYNNKFSFCLPIIALYLTYKDSDIKMLRTKLTGDFKVMQSDLFIILLVADFLGN